MNTFWTKLTNLYVGVTWTWSRISYADAIQIIGLVLFDMIVKEFISYLIWIEKYWNKYVVSGRGIGKSIPWLYKRFYFLQAFERCRQDYSVALSIVPLSWQSSFQQVLLLGRALCTCLGQRPFWPSVFDQKSYSLTIKGFRIKKNASLI